MKRAGMATHTLSTINEGKAIRILSDFLESENKIKTFFKENDRTPNYDGSFEIINDDATPKKQFIVQIKKVENLLPNVRGINKGKYVYSLETQFLYYVKEKVTESPAIYFVVDISNNNIFWLYLSDDFLMKLDFEGKTEMSYAFDESDILTDITAFTKLLNQIAAERNSLFIHKTAEEIADMQDAVDYINKLMDNDFVKIKNWMFPNLWRFGIRHSHSSGFSITSGEKTITPEDTALFSLYPQIKGTIDIGVQEYNGRKDNYFNFFDLSGKTSPMKYSQDCLKKIIKSFFENGIPANYLPEIVLMEKISPSVRKLSKIYNFDRDNGRIKICEILNAFWLIAEYTQNILVGTRNARQEIELKNQIISGCARNRHNFFDMADMCFSYGCKELFEDFCKNHTGNPGFSKSLIPIIKLEDIQLLVILCELNDRKIEYYYQVWDYDFYELTELNDEDFIGKINEICAVWFEKLPELYAQTYDLIFDKNQYRFKGRFEYRNERFKDGPFSSWMNTIIREYHSDSFSVIFNTGISKEFTDDDREKGLVSISSGLLFERFLQRKNLFSDAITCLLYNGICDGLGIKKESLSINHDNIHLF